MTMEQADSGPRSDSKASALEPHAGFDGLWLPPPVGLNLVLNRLPGEIAGPWSQFANALLTYGAIPPGLRELAILRTAARCRSDYIVAAHTMIGRHLGLTEEDLALALAPSRRFAPSRPASPAQTVVTATDQILDKGDVDDRIRRLLDQKVSPGLVPELAMVVGQYVTVSFICKTGRLDPEPGFC
jgi:AhpD family alkylhydroperoxidase